MNELVQVWCAGKPMGKVHVSRISELLSLPFVDARNEGLEFVYNVTDASRAPEVQALIDAGQRPDWTAPTFRLHDRSAGTRRLELPDDFDWTDGARYVVRKRSEGCFVLVRV